MEKAAFFAEARSDLTGPLQGIKVIEATTTWAGPMAGCVLADFGATVIKVEHPEGEILRRVPLEPPGRQCRAPAPALRQSAAEAATPDSQGQTLSAL
ncbi:hypothetical protein EBT16_12180, partial [bacterium]|nr:hypothetical protein [bacterium]